MKKLYFPSKATLNQTNEELIDSYDYLSNAASANDCTGLIPAPPESEAELESYNELYKFEPPTLHNTGYFDSQNMH